MMTVKELKNLLNNYDENLLVEVAGGEGAYGEWAELRVWQVEDASFFHQDGSISSYKKFKEIAVLMEEE